MAEQTQYIQVKNSTGKKIVSGAVTHATTDYGVASISLNGLENGATSKVCEIGTGRGSRDYWWVCWSNNGTDYVAYSNRNAVNKHASSGAPGTVELKGHLGGDLKVVFTTDGDTVDSYDIKNPW